MNITYYIFRHAKAVGTDVDYGDKILTAEVIPEGIGPAKLLGEYFKKIPTDLNVSSTLPRCRQTVAIVQEITGKEFTFDHRLDELYQETFDQFIYRVKDFLRSCHRTYRDHTILICTHGAVIAALKHLLVEGTFSKNELHDYPSPSGLVIVKEKTIQTLNF